MTIDDDRFAETIKAMFGEVAKGVTVIDGAPPPTRPKIFVKINDSEYLAESVQIYTSDTSDREATIAGRVVSVLAERKQSLRFTTRYAPSSPYRYSGQTISVAIYGDRVPFRFDGTGYLADVNIINDGVGILVIIDVDLFAGGEIRVG